MPEFNFATERTICFLLTEDKILLPRKKRGFGERNHNGYGGKKEQEDETIEDTAVREILEEGRITAKVKDLEKRAVIDFHFPYDPKLNQQVTVYFLYKWGGEPVETDEMEPFWFDRKEIPYSKMWDSDHYWLPIVLSGKKIKATFIWKKDNQTIDSYKLEDVTEL
jgi:8-oxo-dGTP diphosphatase